MKINTKILALVAGSLVLASVIYGSLSAWQLIKGRDLTVSKMNDLSTDNIERMNSDSDQFRDELLRQKKEYLKSQVQTTLSVLTKAYKDAHDPDKIKIIYRDSLQNAVNTVMSILRSIEAQTDLSITEKQVRAAELIKSLRYGPEDKDYFWINDMTPKMIMHPYKPELNGQDLSESKDPNGKKLFVEMVAVCKDNGEGFVDYYWPRYGSDEPQPKLSFVKLFKPWNWIIGTGVYLDVAEEKIKADAAAMVEALRYGPENKDYFWINSMEPKMIMHPYKPELNGQNLSETMDPNGKKLFMEMVKVCKEDGEGFVGYDWPKYGADKPLPKLSYVKLFKEWGWVIGTGIYIDDVDAMINARDKALAQKMKAIADGLQGQIDAAETTINENVRSSIITGVLLSLITVLAVLLITYLFIKKEITNPIKKIVTGLDSGAKYLKSASGEVNSANQLLAAGASGQAASIEETSSSLEEMAAMTKQNADHANQADNLMKEANKAVGKANGAMSQLTDSIEEIAKASRETSKIIKTIDEIAFQTNLLALNAAVEAARAGEAGAGFAVVADEVRNLALRAAGAAKNTSELIEGIVVRVKDGSALLAAADETFSQVADNSAKVGDLVSEIAAASDEQASGINQVNIAVTEMDKIVQQNATNAAESTTTSTQMNTQAQRMKHFVEDLVALVDGTANSKKKILPQKRVQGKSGMPHMLSAPSKSKFSPRSLKNKAPQQKIEEVNPDHVIPVDDDFQDF